MTKLAGKICEWCKKEMIEEPTEQMIEELIEEKKQAFQVLASRRNVVFAEAA